MKLPIPTFMKKRPKLSMGVITAILAAIIIPMFASGPDANDDDMQQAPVAVSVLDLSSGLSSTPQLLITGTVKPVSQVQVIAKSQGTFTDQYVKVGDTVSFGQVLARMQDTITQTSFEVAQQQYQNAQQNIDTIELLTNEQVFQAELSLNQAYNAYVIAQDNYESGLIIQENAKAKDLQNAVISYERFLGEAHRILGEVNFLIKAEGNSQVAGINQTIAAHDMQSLITAKNLYRSTDLSYDRVKQTSVTSSNVADSMPALIALIDDTSDVLDAAISVLDATPSSAAFPDTALTAQKQIFAGLRASFSQTRAEAQQLNLSLQNIDLSSQQQLDQLQLALDQASLSYETAKIAFNNAKNSKQQQVLSADSNLRQVSSQYTSAQTQFAELTPQAPIAGIVTKANKDVGDQVRIGDILFEISNTNALQIESTLSSQDIYKIALGQDVRINGRVDGVVSQIDPIADPLTKKVGIEITFDQKENIFIPETSVNIALPIQLPNQEEGLWIPLKAVIIAPTESFVYIAENDTAKKVSVKTGAVEFEQVAVQGLDNSMQVIVEGNKRVSDGDAISIQ